MREGQRRQNGLGDLVGPGDVDWRSSWAGLAGGEEGRDTPEGGEGVANACFSCIVPYYLLQIFSKCTEDGGFSSKSSKPAESACKRCADWNTPIHSLMQASLAQKQSILQVWQ